MKLLSFPRSALVLFGLAFIGAGINHFVMPYFYLPLIPDYLPYKSFLNLASGILEVALGCLILYKPYQKMAGYGVVILLVLFVPSHIWMIQSGDCFEVFGCLPAWVVWTRLLIGQPVFIYLALSAAHSNNT